MTKPQIIIIPGNGDSHIETDHWYGWLRGKLIGLGYTVIAKDMPDPVVAHANVWLPHLEQVYHSGPNSILVGHSSGAVATLRYLETHKLAGAVVIGCNYTDLGDATEAASGYYTEPWQWDKIKANARFIGQFASSDDPYIPIAEPRFIHDKIDSDYFEFDDRGHFMFPRFPELVEYLTSKIKF